MLPALVRDLFERATLSKGDTLKGTCNNPTVALSGAARKEQDEQLKALVRQARASACCRERNCVTHVTPEFHLGMLRAKLASTRDEHKRERLLELRAFRRGLLADGRAKLTVEFAVDGQPVCREALRRLHGLSTSSLGRYLKDTRTGNSVQIRKPAQPIDTETTQH